MPLISSLALAPVLLKTGGATLATCGTTSSFAAGTTAAVGGGAAATGGKVLGVAMLTKGFSSAAKSGAFTKVGSSAAAAHAAVAPAAATAPALHAAPVAAAAPAVQAAPIVQGAPIAGAAPIIAAAPAVVAAPAIAAAGPGAAAAATGAAALPASTTGVAAATEAAAAPAAGHGKHLTMIATVIGIMVLRAVANRYWLAKPTANKNRLVRRVCRWSKEEQVAVEADEEFGQIPQLPFKEEPRRYVEAGTGAPAPTGGTSVGGSRVSGTRATDAGLTDIETTASTQETRRRRVSYVRRAKGKLHRFL